MHRPRPVLFFGLGCRLLDCKLLREKLTLAVRVEDGTLVVLDCLDFRRKLVHRSLHRLYLRFHRGKRFHHLIQYHHIAVCVLRSTILTLRRQTLQTVAWTFELLLIILRILICLFHNRLFEITNDLTFD